jgi:hypothetical protein
MRHLLQLLNEVLLAETSRRRINHQRGYKEKPSSTSVFRTGPGNKQGPHDFTSVFSLHLKR